MTCDRGSGAGPHLPLLRLAKPAGYGTGLLAAFRTAGIRGICRAVQTGRGTKMASECLAVRTPLNLLPEGDNFGNLLVAQGGQGNRQGFALGSWLPVLHDLWC